MNIRIDPEFESLIPPLSPDESRELEASLMAEGCRDALVLWGDTLIDGHNRYAMCKAHGIPFQTVSREFENRQEVIEWIIRNQFGRRNLPAYERARLALKLKPVIAARAKAKESSHTAQGYQKSENPVHTAKELAKVAGVSHDTIAKVERIEALADPEDKEDLRSGEVSINQVYQRLRRQERQQEQAEHEERLKAGRQSAQAYIDTVKRQRGMETDEPVTDLQLFRAAKEEIRYDQEMESYRLIKLLSHTLDEVRKLPDDDRSYEAMWRGSIDPLADVRSLRKAIERLNRIMAIFVKKGDKDVDEIFDEMLEDGKSPD